MFVLLKSRVPVYGNHVRFEAEIKVSLETGEENRVHNKRNPRTNGFLNHEKRERERRINKTKQKEKRAEGRKMEREDKK